MALPYKLAVKALLVAGSLAAPTQAPRPAAVPDMIAVPATTFAYRLSGDFQKDGQIIDAPRAIRATPSFAIMKYQLTTAQYDACAGEGACLPRPARESRNPRLPAVQLSFEDAEDYARWLSARTGANWRLPSDLEWRAAAGTRAPKNALNPPDGADPSARWLARYDEESAAARFDERLRPLGAFGANERGLYDLAGNVWEWTRDCFVRYAVGPTGPRALTTNCGVRVVEGEHRAYITDFVRDARGGGCSFGKPPSHLGVRLVREDQPSLTARLRRLIVGGLRWI